MKRTVLNGKTIVFTDEECNELIRPGVDLGEKDCRHYLAAFYREGSILTGYNEPDIDKIINDHSAESLKSDIVKMARIEAAI